MPKSTSSPAKPAKIDPIRPTDDSARQLAHELMASAKSGSLATLQNDGHPFSSLVSLSLDADRTPLILVSRLSAHTSHLLHDPRASLLITTTGLKAEKGDPLAHPRMTLVVMAAPILRESAEHERCRGLFLEKQPKAALYIDFGDFLLVRLTIVRASLNGGFGKAYELGPEDILGVIKI